MNFSRMIFTPCSDTWYTSREKCLGCKSYNGGCLYDLELEEKADGVPEGTYTKATSCPYFYADEEYDD